MADRSTYSAFLQLPGELRNRIYQFTIESGIYLFRRQARVDSKLGSKCPSSTQFFELTQVSRQLRSETLPLYRSHSTIVVHHRDMDSFYRTFVVPPDQKAEFPGLRVAVDMYTPGVYPKVDLMPVVRMLTQSLVTEILLVDSEKRDPAASARDMEIATLKGLSACLNNSKFRQYVLKSTHSLTMREWQLWLDMRAEHIEPWMLEWNDATENCGGEDEAIPLLQGSTWLEKTGLGLELVFENIWFD